LWDRIDTCAIIVIDIVVIGGSFLVISLGMWLGICSEVGQLSAEGARRATASAGAAEGLASAAYWPIVKAIENSVLAPSGNPGILVRVEQRAVQTALYDVTFHPERLDAFAELLTAPLAAPAIP
jgi:hypothetical protein